MIGFYFIDRVGSQISYSKEDVWPDTYLSYAQQDYMEYESTGSPKDLINAVSNAKRALHYQVDGLCEALGWMHLKKKNDFPSKLEFLKRCGLLSPTIVKRINRLRNTIEHDYYIPTEDETLEYLEIVELYLAALHISATYFPDNCTVELMDDSEDYDSSWKLPPWITIEIPEKSGQLRITSREGTLLDLCIKDEGYYAWISAIMRQSAC